MASLIQKNTQHSQAVNSYIVDMYLTTYFHQDVKKLHYN